MAAGRRPAGAKPAAAIAIGTDAGADRRLCGVAHPDAGFRASCATASSPRCSITPCAKWRCETFAHVHTLSLRFHLERKTGGLSRVIERGTKGIDTLLSFALFSIFPTIFQLLAVLQRRSCW